MERLLPASGGRSGRHAVRLAGLRLLGALLRGGGDRRRGGPSGSAPRRIVVLRPDHLGDVLLCRPAIELLREALPMDEIAVIVGPWGAPSLQGLAARVVTFPFPGFTRQPKAHLLAPYGALLALAARLRREAFDAAVILRPDHWWGALACSLAGVPVRVGHDTPETLPFLTHPVPWRDLEPSLAAALRTSEELLRVLEVDVPKLHPGVTFSPTPGALEKARRWVGDHGPSSPDRSGLRTPTSRRGGRRPLMALHPGAGAPIKVWPPHRWARVLDALTDEGVAALITGGAEEAPLVAALQDRLARPLPAALGLSWDDLAALYCQVDLVVGLDSGPLHLAEAVGTPTVRIYGPSDPRIHGPSGDGRLHGVLQAGVPCAPCGDFLGPPCGHWQDPPCLASVPVADVLAAIRTSLSRRRVS